VRVAIIDFKQPVDIATQPRGTAPFIVDERAVKIGFPMSRNAVKTFWDNNDYYPYGMLIPERSWSSSDYRYGYNGKENDNELKGTGNSIDYGARIFDPRIGRFFKKDPLQHMSQGTGNYQYAANSPIMAADYEGAFIFFKKINPVFEQAFNLAKMYNDFKGFVSKFENINDKHLIIARYSGKSENIASFYGFRNGSDKKISDDFFEEKEFGYHKEIYASIVEVNTAHEVNLLAFDVNNVKTIFNLGYPTFTTRYIFNGKDINDLRVSDIGRFQNLIFSIIHEGIAHYLNSSPTIVNGKSDIDHMEYYGTKDEKMLEKCLPRNSELLQEYRSRIASVNPNSRAVKDVDAVLSMNSNFILNALMEIVGKETGRKYIPKRWVKSEIECITPSHWEGGYFEDEK